MVSEILVLNRFHRCSRFAPFLSASSMLSDNNLESDLICSQLNLEHLRGFYIMICGKKSKSITTMEWFAFIN